MSDTPSMCKYEYGRFELNDKGEIIDTMDEYPPIHIKQYYGNEDEGRCIDKLGLLHLMNELADINPDLHKQEYLRSLLFKSYSQRDKLRHDNAELKRVVGVLYGIIDEADEMIKANCNEQIFKEWRIIRDNRLDVI